MATKMKVAQLDQGAVHNAAESANNVAFDFHMCKKKFTDQNFHLTKISPVKLSPLDTTGEIGENLPLAKISRYTVEQVTAN